MSRDLALLSIWPLIGQSLSHDFTTISPEVITPKNLSANPHFVASRHQ